MEAIEPVQPAPVSGGTLPLPAESPLPDTGQPRLHLVVVSTRAIEARETPAPGPALRTRFWHPRDQRWSENEFESLEHALRLFVDESGWVLRQDQALDAPMAREWIFEARRSDFTQPSKEEILRDIGLTPEGVTRMLEERTKPPDPT